jgi:peptide-methionine (S)-S-oxide reductase
VGYTGGRSPAPTYHSLGDHTETLQVEFDPDVLSYRDLLEIFWRSHDPTGRAWSVQYKVAVFVSTADQQRLAHGSRELLASSLPKRIRTEILPAERFYRAEDYHQKYYLRNTPKLMREFKLMYPSEKAFCDSTAAARVNGYIDGAGDTRDLLREIDEYGLSEEGKALLLGRGGVAPGCGSSCGLG